MPRQIRLIINLVFSCGLFLLLLSKAANTFSRFGEISELWQFGDLKYGEGTQIRAVFFVCGIYPAILLTAVSVWTRGVLPIVLSALGTAVSFVLYCFEIFFTSLFKEFEIDMYMGLDPLISAWVCIIAFFMLAISIAELIIAKKKRLY